MNTNKTTARQREIIRLYAKSIRQALIPEWREAIQYELRGFLYGLETCGFIPTTEAKNIIDRWCK